MEHCDSYNRIVGSFRNYIRGYSHSASIQIMHFLDCVDKAVEADLTDVSYFEFYVKKMRNIFDTYRKEPSYLALYFEIATEQLSIFVDTLERMKSTDRQLVDNKRAIGCYCENVDGFPMYSDVNWDNVSELIKSGKTEKVLPVGTILCDSNKVGDSHYTTRWKVVHITDNSIILLCDTDMDEYYDHIQSIINTMIVRTSDTMKDHIQSVRRYNENEKGWYTFFAPYISELGIPLGTGEAWTYFENPNFRSHRLSYPKPFWTSTQLSSDQVVVVLPNGTITTQPYNHANNIVLACEIR